MVYAGTSNQGTLLTEDTDYTRSGNVISGLAAGDYWVDVVYTDNLGTGTCIAGNGDNVGSVAEITLQISADIDCDLGPSGLPSGTVTVTGSGYQKLVLYNAADDSEVETKETSSSNVTFTGLASGSYYVKALAPNSAGTADACEATSNTATVEACYWIQIYKETNGLVDATRDWTFKIYAGSSGFGTTALASDNTLGDADGFLDFGFYNLDPAQTYTVCEENMAAGWSAIWITANDGTVLMTYNPNASDNPSQDLGNRCFEIGAGTAYPLVANGTFTINVNNTYPGGAARTPGYWKNWNTCTNGGQADNALRNGGWQQGYWLLDDVLNDPGVTLGALTVLSCADGVNILDQRDISTSRKKASDAAYNLAMHLMAFKLNQAAGAYYCGYAWDAAMAADELLIEIKYNGTGDYFKGKKEASLKSRALELAGILDRYNNNDLGEGECSQSFAITATMDGADAMLDYTYPNTTPTTLTASPIPFDDQLSLKLEVGYESMARIEIYDLSGRLIMSREEYVYPGTNIFDVSDVFRIPTQLSIIRVTTEREPIMQKIVSFNQK